MLTSFIRARDDYLELAEMLTGKTIKYLTPPQEDYLQNQFDRLPSWCQHIIEAKLNGACWPDAYAELAKQRLEKAIKIAKETVNPRMFTLSSESMYGLCLLGKSDVTKSFDDVVELTCRNEMTKDEYPDAEQELRAFISNHFISSGQAMTDCEVLLSQTAFKDELNKFRKAVCRNFPDEHLNDSLSYPEALEVLENIALTEAKDNEHFRKAITSTISKLKNAISGHEYAEIMNSRKDYLVRLLPIDAKTEHIRWALSDNVLIRASLKPSTVESLLHLGYYTIADLIDRPIDAKYTTIKEQVQELLNYIANT